MSEASSRRRRFFAPEVIQTSTMDCGPASLTAMLRGFGVHVSYGRLREACQTAVDGTSIDALEEIANELGVDAAQTMLPTDMALLDASEMLPAIVVMRLPSRETHFVVVWRRHGAYFQVMDPGTGRRWVHRDVLLRELYVHTMALPAEDYRGWLATSGFRAPLAARLSALGASSRAAGALVDDAAADDSGDAMSTLDASVRLVASVVDAGGLRRGREALRAVTALRDEARATPEAIPDAYWCARPIAQTDGGVAHVRMKGAILVSMGRRAGTAPVGADAKPLPPELQLALDERAAPPGAALFAILKADGLATPAVVALALLLAAVGTVVEAVLLRGLFDAGRYFLPGAPRAMAVLAIALFVLALTLLEVPIAAAVLRVGRNLETRVRAAYLEKLPRLGYRYFSSRPASDMAERGHALHVLRRLPDIGARLLRTLFTLVLTTLGIAWLSPAAAPLAALMALVAVALPFAVHPLLAERDLRFRTHQGALSRFYLDALLGLVPIRAHNAARTVRREHEGLLVDWTTAGYAIQRASVVADAVLALTSLGLSAWLLARHGTGTLEIGRVLLLVYWTLQIPALGEDLAMGLRSYPALRNVTLRLLELLNAKEESVTAPDAPPAPRRATAPTSRTSRGCEITFDGVSARAGGHDIVRDVSLHVRAGEHVAIVGASGAGKSTLVGMLLGWLTPTDGRILVDGAPLDPSTLLALRADTAWLDPSVHLWNRALLDNLLYGADGEAQVAMNELFTASDLRPVLARLPDGLRTVLGEGGALVSGGEGQRVRFGRALTRPRARLAILDEPFRGLDRDQRRALLTRARATFREATLLCVTHDVDETRGFDRVLVVEDGRIIEDGRPEALVGDPSSRYATLLEVERRVRSELWAREKFRRIRLENGVLREAPTLDHGEGEARS